MHIWLLLGLKTPHNQEESGFNMEVLGQRQHSKIFQILNDSSLISMQNFRLAWQKNKASQLVERQAYDISEQWRSVSAL